MDELQSDRVESLVRSGNFGVKSTESHSCCFCQKVLFNRQALRNHLKNVHLRTEKNSCNICQKIFFSRYSLQNHNKVHQTSNLSCNFCDYKTNVKKNLQKHELTHAAKDECPICKKQVSHLKFHLKTHRSKVPCPICSKMLSRDFLKEHIETHRAKKCDTCGEFLENDEELRRYVWWNFFALLFITNQIFN